MNRSHFTPFVVFIGSLVVLFAASPQSFAATFSGKVIDEKGNPVPDVVIAIQPSSDFRPVINIDDPEFNFPLPSTSDETGAFSIKDITPNFKSSLKLSPNERFSDYRLLSIKIAGITIALNPQYSRFAGFPFAIEPETDIEDVEITVRLRMRIRGQVLTEDGTPLSNTQVDLMVRRRSINGGGRGSSGGTETLDIDGGFTRYVNSPAYYTVSVKYQGQSAESKEILLEEGQRLDGLTLTLSGDPQLPRKPKVVKAVRMVNPERRQAAWQRQREGVWAINPDNRHAYKRIYSDTHEEAFAQATAQGAHLIAINDKAEQEWILEVFGKENYWIGSINDAKEGSKKWDNGDPVTYTNWDTEQLIPESDETTEKDEKLIKKLTVLVGVTGKWQQIREGSPVASITEKAILEKKDLIIGAPEPDEDIE
ncbi:MAG: lectin-like protein [Candidatus Poribacteria bacterium]|nr:lectin-like protein [Candidatus Poribacteria bacterium]